MFIIFIIQAVSANQTLNYSLVQDKSQLAALFMLGQFIQFEHSLNINTEPQLYNNTNFAYQLIENTNYTLEQYDLTKNHTQNMSLDVFNNSHIPDNPLVNQMIQKFILNWQKYDDKSKSIILQTVLLKAAQLSKSTDPLEQLVELQKLMNLTQVLEENLQKINTSDYIAPINWQSQNLTNDQYYLSKFFASAYEKNMTAEQYFQTLTQEEQTKTYQTFCTLFNINETKGTNPVPTDDGGIIIPQINPPKKTSTENSEEFYMYLVFILMFLLIIGIFYLLRRYMIQKQMIGLVEESGVQGLSA